MLSLESAQKRLRDDGFIHLDDEYTGAAVSEMAMRGFPYLTPYGLDYCKQHILDNEQIRTTIESLLGNCSLGHWLRYKALPNHYECFRRGGKEAGLRALIVEQWASDSEVSYYRGSHLLDLPTKQGERSLHETTCAALQEAGCDAETKKFPEGALVIRDARLYTEIKKGYAIMFIFATDQALAGWPKIVLANSPDLIRKVVKMETSRIRVNFAIKESA